MKKVVVTGATSMLGIALIEECIKNGIQVLAIIRKDSKRRERLPKSELVTVYEAELDELNRIDADGQYDVFYHFAWEGSTKKDRDDALLQYRNIEYTLQAVKLAKRLNCHKFIGAGSQAEYGSTDRVIGPETAICPELAYGIAKYAAGRLSGKLCEQYGMIHIWARVFSVYGCYDNAGTMIQYAMSCFAKKQTAQFSAATQMWDYLYEKDAGKIFYYLGVRAGSSKVYCVASGHAVMLKEYIVKLQHTWGEEAECSFAPQNAMNNRGLQADIEELVQDIGYRPDTEFENGIREVVEYTKQKHA